MKSTHPNRYRSKVENGEHAKIREKIKKLDAENRQQIYVERKFKEESTGRETSVEDLVMDKNTVLIKGQVTRYFTVNRYKHFV